MLVATCVATAGMIAQNTALQQQIRRQLLPVQVRDTQHDGALQNAQTATVGR
jgi:hypothetical protein